VHFIAESGDGIVGNIVCQVVPLVPRPCRVHDSCAVITDNYVKPTDRSNGIGSELLRRAVEWARELDLELIIVWPSEQARIFYGRHGFSERTEIMELVLRPAYVEPV